MANIKTFEAPALGLTPSETGVESTAAAARRLGAFYNQAADSLGIAANLKQNLGARIGSTIRDVGDTIDTIETHREVSHGMVTFSKMQQQLTDQWNDLAKSSDPNDPSTVGKFRDEVLEPALDNFTGAFTTEKAQKWAEEHADALRQHMGQKAIADMATKSGIAVKNNVVQATTAMSNTAYNDPSSVDFQLESVDHNINGIVNSSPNLKGADAAKVRDSVSQDAKAAIVKAGFQGAIAKSKDPEATAQEWIKKYPEYIDGSEANQFAKAAKAQSKANLLTEKQLQIYGRQQQEHAAEAESSKIISDNMSTDENGQITIKPDAIKQSIELARKYPDAGAGIARTMINFFEAQQNKEVKVVDNPGVVRTLTDQLFDTEHPLTERDLMKASADGKISNPTYSRLKGMINELETTPLKGPVFQDTMKAVHSSLVLSGVGVPGKDDVGETNYAKFVQTFIPQYLAQYRAGTLPPNALDVKDPKSLISQSMEPFKRTPQQRIQDYTSSWQSGGTAPVQGPARVTTKADYDKLPVGTRYIGKDGQTYEKR